MDAPATIPLKRVGEARRVDDVVQPFPDITLDYTVIEGARPGTRLLVTAGVHGSEVCAIETALRCMQLSQEDINGTVTILPILNVEGFRQHSIFVMPQDGKNLNRQFPGKPDGTVSERLADWLVTEIFPHFDAYLDLHSGDATEDLRPFTLFLAGSEPSRDLAMAFGLTYAVESKSSGMTICGARDVGLPGIIVEVGQGGRWTEEEVGQMSAGVGRVLKHLDMLAPADGTLSGLSASPMAIVRPEDKKAIPVRLEGVAITAEVGGFWHRFTYPKRNVAAGELLGEIRDLHGTRLQTVRSGHSGFYLYGSAALSVSAGDVLAYIGVMT